MTVRGEMAEWSAWTGWSLLFIWSVSFVWLNQIDQMNQINPRSSRFSRQSRPSRLSQASAIATEAFMNHAGKSLQRMAHALDHSYRSTCTKVRGANG
jgi:hypothetical protein